jgi:hypothetical protein
MSGCVRVDDEKQTLLLPSCWACWTVFTQIHHMPSQRSRTQAGAVLCRTQPSRRRNTWPGDGVPLLVSYYSICTWTWLYFTCQHGHLGQRYALRLTKGRAMAQAVSRRPLTVECRVRARVIPWGSCGWQSLTATGFSPTSSVLPCQCHSTVFPILIYHPGDEQYVR